VILSDLASVPFLAGCLSGPEQALSDKEPKYATLPNGYEPLNPTQPSAMYADAMSSSVDTVVRYTLSAKLVTH